MSATLSMSTHGSFGLLSAAASVEVDVNPQLVLTQLALLTLLFLVLKPLLFDPLIRLFEARDRRIAGARKRAREMDDEAAELLRRYETELAEVHRVAGEERDKVRTEVQREETRILAEARAEVQLVLDQGRAKLREEGKALDFALGQSSSEIARDVANRVLGREVSLTMRSTLVRTFGAAGGLGACLVVALAPVAAFAQDPHGTPPARPQITAMPRPMPMPGPGGSARAPRPMPAGERAGDHGGAAAHEGEHDVPGTAHEPGGHHALESINWYNGFLGEKEGASPNDVLWRAKGRPVPLLANFINLAILVAGGVYVARKPMADGLVKRKDDLEREMQEAAKVQAAAEVRLAEYRQKIDGIDAEITRVRADYAEQAKREQERILREADEKRERMRRDTEFLLDQEGKLIRQALLRQTVDAATEQAEAMIRKGLTAQDQDRIAEEFLKGLSAANASSSVGGAR